MNATVTLSLDQQDAIERKLGSLSTLISVFVAASTGHDTFVYFGFALMLEDKYAELYDTILP